MKLNMAPLLLSVTVLSSGAQARVIYGEDNRQEVFQASEKNQILARSTPVMVPNTAIISKEDSTIDLLQRSFGEWASSSSKLLHKAAGRNAQMGLCADERFAEQPNPGVCSGFLIAPDLIVTAGHCTEMDRACENFSWVFDFKVDQETVTAGVNVKSENIYRCKRIVTKSLNMSLMTDYALIQLDRPVTDRGPLQVRLEGSIADRTEITVIGNPSGLPLKVSDKANVRNNTNSIFFSANLDTFQGNSGSAVFNSETGVVEGLLVRGEDDFTYDMVGKCMRANKCENTGCRGEDVSRILSIPEIALKTLMNTAAEVGDSATLDEILSFNVWVDFYLQDGQSSLMKAAAKGQSSSLTILLAHGADVNLVDVNGDTALHHLARVLSPETADALNTLVAGGAKLDMKNKLGQTPMMIAEAACNVEGVKLLLQIVPQSDLAL
jgi:hypothetical protein